MLIFLPVFAAVLQAQSQAAISSRLARTMGAHALTCVKKSTPGRVPEDCHRSLRDASCWMRLSSTADGRPMPIRSCLKPGIDGCIVFCLLEPYVLDPDEYPRLGLELERLLPNDAPCRSELCARCHSAKV